MKPVQQSGRIVWVDLSTKDVDAAKRFYGGLLGWQFADTGPYTVARSEDDDVAGMMAMPEADAAAGMPSCWTVIIGAGSELDALVDKASALGGSVLQAPMPIPGGARIAVIADPTGAVVALMESPPSERSMAWGAPGSVSWVECLSRGPEASRHFYEDLFGWKGEDGRGSYVVFHLDGERVAGMMATPPGVPAEVPSYWLTYFGVADVEAACRRTVELGGAVLEPAHDIEEGRFAILEDPTGAVFAVLQDPLN